MEVSERETHDQIWVSNRSIWLQCERELEGVAWRQGDWLHSLKGCVEMRIVQGIKIGAFDLAEREKMVTSGRLPGFSVG